MHDNIIDHIVYGVPDFEKAIADLTEKLGVKPVFGGKHVGFGTQNACVHLGDQCYLEILANDDQNTSFQGQKWMGIDMISKPSIIRWAAKSTELVRDSHFLREYDINHGCLATGERITPENDTLQWKMTLPTASSIIDIVPFLLDWSDSTHHPCDLLESTCKLLSIDFYHPHPEQIQPLFLALGIEKTIIFSSKPKISVIIRGRKGDITL